MGDAHDVLGTAFDLYQQAQAAIKLLKHHVEAELCQGWWVLAMAHCAKGYFQAAEQAIQCQLSLDSALVGPCLLMAILLA